VFLIFIDDISPKCEKKNWGHVPSKCIFLEIFGNNCQKNKLFGLDLPNLECMLPQLAK
jgi:hypothetical protein